MLRTAVDYSSINSTTIIPVRNGATTRATLNLSIYYFIRSISYEEKKSILAGSARQAGVERTYE